LVDVVSFHPQGTHLATGCHDGRLRLWDVHTNQATKTIDAHVQPAVAAIYCLAWTADGKQIVTGSLDGSLKLWDAAAGTLVREFKAYKPKEFEKGHRDAVFCCSLSPDGKFLASGSNDRTIKIWNVADGSVALELVNPNLKVPDGVLPPNPPHSHPGWVYGLRYTHDGRFLISAGNSPPSKAYLAVWNATDGKLLDGKTLDVGPIHSLALGPPDSRVVGIACGTTNLQATEAFGYLLKMPDVAK
jgi:WD40 repeat protein